MGGAASSPRMTAGSDGLSELRLAVAQLSAVCSTVGDVGRRRMALDEAIALLQTRRCVVGGGGDDEGLRLALRVAEESNKWSLRVARVGAAASPERGDPAVL